jgi:hypothetical protein
MRFILNQFNPYDGKYQIPVRIESKKKFGKIWYLFVEFPKGNAEYMDIDSVEKNTITVINTKKLRNRR